MRIAIVGSGYVGLVTAACLAELGHQVISVDNDAAKVAALKRGVAPIHELFLPELIQRHVGSRLTFSDDLASAAKASKVIFIAVGTPSQESGDADLSYVESAVREIAHSVDGGFKVIVEKSTVPVFTNHWIRRTLDREGAGAASFEVASNPEFLREGTAVTDFLFPDRIVIGADSERCREMMLRVYAPLIKGEYGKSATAIPAPSTASVPPQVITTSTQAAELIKHASNAFLAMKVSFINAVASLCENLGADIEEVCRGIGSDSRIGPRFLKPGLGYGGSCFPKDLLAFGALARERGYDFRLLEEVARINEEQRERFLRRIRRVLWTLKGKRLGVLGLAFKGGTDDVRESPAIYVLKALLKEGCLISVYDPAAMEQARMVLPPEVGYAANEYEAAEKADALLILTDWEEFSNLDLDRLRKTMKQAIVVDGRNLYDPQSMAERGFTYCSVGRADAAPQAGNQRPARTGSLKRGRSSPRL